LDHGAERRGLFGGEERRASATVICEKEQREGGGGGEMASFPTRRAMTGDGGLGDAKNTSEEFKAGRETRAG